jgi:hypothetical protein
LKIRVRSVRIVGNIESVVTIELREEDESKV